MEGERYVLVFSDADGNPKYVNFYFSTVQEATDFAIKNHYQSYQVMNDYEFQEWRREITQYNQSQVNSNSYRTRTLQDVYVQEVTEEGIPTARNQRPVISNYKPITFRPVFIKGRGM